MSCSYRKFGPSLFTSTYDKMVKIYFNYILERKYHNSKIMVTGAEIAL